jgi:GH25 family lysozyme M1 (1,4-beta-N-acetylmuramidase)
MLRGFDISAYQGAEDLPGFVRAYALDFVICRAWQSNSVRDQAFPGYWRQLAGLDVVRGAYCFAHSGTNATISADRFVDYVLEQGPLHPTDLLVLDLESNLGNLSANALAAWGLAWAARVVERCPGHKPVYYGGYPVHAQYRGFAQAFSAWWFARYPTAYSTRPVWPKQFIATVPADYWPGGPTIWQFSQDFPVGPNDPHDASVSPLTREQLRSLNPGAADMPLTDAEFARLQSMIDAAVQKVTDQLGGDRAYYRVHHAGEDLKNVASPRRAIEEIWTGVDELQAQVSVLQASIAAGGVPTQPAGLSLDDIRHAVGDVIGQAVVTTSTTITAP